MGRWNNKRRFGNPRRGRNYESYYDNPPRSPPPSPPNPGIDDGVPLWEKNFCYYIGTIGWRKVVSAKMFMHCHAIVVNWDDSASKEAFQNARTRYWAEINGLPSHVSLPDPDMYIDEINWNPDIDPQLINDLELSFFAPPDDQVDTRWGPKSNKTRKLLSGHLELSDKVPHSQGCTSNAADSTDPWERCYNLPTAATLKDKLPGWNQLNGDANNSINLKTDDNPWESGSPPRDEVVKGNSWGDGGNKSWGWNRVNKFDNWNNDGDLWKSTCHAEDRGWGNQRNSYNQQEPRKSNIGYNSWLNSRSYNQGSGISKNRGWRDNGGQGRGSKQYNYHNDPTNLEPERSSCCWRDWNKGYRESEGAHHQQTTGCRRAQFSRDNNNNYSTANGWSRGRNKKRDNFAID